jgi:twitching motility two-component system response regulator PilG
MARNSLEKGIAAAKSGNKLLARLHLLEAAERSPQDPTCWMWLAWAAESPDDAVSSLKKAIAIDPENEIARAGLSWSRGMAEMVVPSVAPAAQAPTYASVRPESRLGQVSAVPKSRLGLAPLPSIPAGNGHGSATALAEPPVLPDFDAPAHRPAPSSEFARVATAPAFAPAVAPPAPVAAIPPSSPPPASAPTEPPPYSGPRRPLVLVVDDSPTVCKLVSITLSKRGYQIVSASDGIDALDVISSNKPDLILLDITMPRLDGYKLCKIIRGHDETREIPVIMLSGKDGFFDKARGKFVGCTSYITKPFEPEALIQEVERHLVASPVSVAAAAAAAAVL